MGMIEKVMAFAKDIGSVRRVVLLPQGFAELLHERLASDPNGVDMRLYSERIELVSKDGTVVEVTKSSA